jgi:hypothetical protein
MLRARLVLFGCLALSVYVGCSGDADGGDAEGDGGSASSNAGSDGGSGTGVAGSGVGGSGGSGVAGSGVGGSAGGGATYTAAEACQLFAQSSCNKGVECGLVLAQSGTQLVCLECNALALGLITQTCQQDSPGDKAAADVDRCVANITAQPCAQACTDLNVPGCDVFGELVGDPDPVVCDPRCAE